MSTQATIIPYERQSDSQTGRMCGAACLNMVYRSFGQDIGQAAIWPAIAQLNRFGSLASTTHLMARDARSRGYSALAIGARHPLQTLRHCHEHDIRAILNHRLDANSAAGHYTVMTDFDEASVVLHDPYHGPARRISHEALLQLWKPLGSDSEITGGGLIAIASHPAAAADCQYCHTPIPATFDCPHCKNPIGLAPAQVLGCVKQSCIARVWNYVCCPACDALSDLASHAPKAESNPDNGGKRREPAPNAEPARIQRIIEEMDRFCARIQTLPGAANHAELQQQIQILMDTRAPLRRASAEGSIYGQAHRDQLAAFVQRAGQTGEAQSKKVADANAPLPPLDGNALGRALLQDLGFKT